MKLTNQELENYVGRIKLTLENKKKYTDQIENLIEELRSKINEHTDMKVTKVLRTGSWKKGTALRPSAANPLDIDLVFFLDLEEASAQEIDNLHDTLLDFLIKSYPTKKKEDFTGGEKTVGLEFKSSGLSADLVPVVPIETRPDYVWQPSKKKARAVYVTSVTKQLKFASDIKIQDSTFSPVVRMLKAWKNRQEIELSSFAIELLVAILIIREGPANNIEEAIIRFFEFVSQGDLKPMLFPSATGTQGVKNGPAYLGDPTNNENNVLDRVKEDEWTEIVGAANSGWETITYAQSVQDAKGRTVDLWKEIFGPHFNISKDES